MKPEGNCSCYILLAGIALLLSSPIGAQSDCPVAPTRGGECWTTEDVIDGHIDHHAQSAMLRMFAGGGEAAEDASAILCAVKTRQLEGVYKSNLSWPAKRAQAAGSSWWHIIPQGKNSECYKEPTTRPPLIAFRREIKDNRDSVAVALSDAWKNNCDIPPTGPRCYIATITKPPQEDPEPNGKCTERLQCDPSWGPDKILEACSIGGFPANGECLSLPGEECGVCGVSQAPPPRCGGPGECMVALERCPDGSECLPLAGYEDLDYSCGYCKGSKPEHADCIKEAWAQYKKDIALCDEKEKDALPDCVKKFATCTASILGGAASEAFKKCLGGVYCFVGGPSHRRFDCGGKAATKKSKTIQECRKRHL